MTCLKAGDTLLVRGGTYNESFQDNAIAGTSWTTPVRIANYAGETVWVTPTSIPGVALLNFQSSQQYVEFDGINMDGRAGHVTAVVEIQAWSGGNAHHIRFKNAEWIPGSDGIPNGGTAHGVFGAILINDRVGSIGFNEFIRLTIHGGGDPGDMTYAFYIQSSDNLVDACELYDQQGLVMQIYNGNSGGTPRNNVIRNSVIHDTTRTVTGFSMTGLLVDGDNTQVYNNVIYGMRNANGESDGILVYYGSNTAIYNNTIYDNQTYGINLYNATGTIVKNNISYKHTADFVNNGTSTISSNNLFGVNPLFVGPADFRLQPASPAKDTGAAISTVGTDIIGVARPQSVAYDIGAYEAVTKAPPQPPIGVHLAY